jgi:hypothetical protein
MRYAVIGDIHGQRDRLELLLAVLPPVDLTIFVGDYVDRGPDPIGVLERVAALPKAIRLCGNHEYKLMRRRARGEPACADEVQPADEARFWRAMEACVGDQPTYFYRTEHLLVTHAPAYLWQHDPAGYKPDKLCYGFTASDPESPEGFRRRKMLAEIYPGETSMRPVIFGHIHQHTCGVDANVFCADLGADLPKGCLAGIILEDDHVVDVLRAR